MSRRFESGKLVIASHNPGKVREIGELLAPFGVEVVSAGDLGLDEPVEDGQTFIANAEIKAKAAATASGLPALADDSGLAVHALNNEPGIYSARWGGPEKDFTMAMKRVIKELDGQDNRTAHFACALSLCWPDGHCETFEGQVHGIIADELRGDKGFGYDPIFVPKDHNKTFAEIDPQDKHAMSHRANAFKLLVAACFAPE